LDALTSHDASSGLRAALSQGVDTAVSQLGVPNGFLNDPKVAIPLPPALEKADRALRMVGMGGEADKLKVGMNHAAEMAVADAKPIFKAALQRMSVSDARASSLVVRTLAPSISDALLARSSRPNSSQRSPAKPKAAARLRVRQVCRQGGELGLVNKQDAEPQRLVTSKALDGLFSRIADEEHAIRKDPLGQANSLIKKVFAARSLIVHEERPSRRWFRSQHKYSGVPDGSSANTYRVPEVSAKPSSWIHTTGR